MELDESCVKLLGPHLAIPKAWRKHEGLRYVGVIRFVFHVLQLLLVEFYNKNQQTCTFR